MHDRTLWEMPVARADSVVEGRLNPSSAIASWYEVLSAQMGYTVAPSAKWLNATTYAYLARHDLVAAEAAAQEAVAAYPEDIGSYGEPRGCPSQSRQHGRRAPHSHRCHAHA